MSHDYWKRRNIAQVGDGRKGGCVSMLLVEGRHNDDSARESFIV